MMYQRPSLLPIVLCATAASMASASAVAGGMHHTPSDPLAAMAAYARFAHDVISLPAAAAAAKPQQKNQRNLQFTDGRWTQMASMCGAVGGSLLDGNKCEICPGDEDDGCCFIDLATFAFSCNICETIDGVEECAEVQCGLTDVGGYTCDGCGDYSSGQACFNFDCDENGDCTCNSITWNDQDCGECIIDEAGNPSFDCSSVGGPDGTTIGEDMTNPPAGSGGGTAPPVGEDIEICGTNMLGDEQCIESTCYETENGAYGCNGCFDYVGIDGTTWGEACYNYFCPEGFGDSCICDLRTLNGVDCRSCTVGQDGFPRLDCGNVGPDGPDGTTSAAEGNTARWAVFLSLILGISASIAASA